MTRKEAETEIYIHMTAIKDICQQYYPEDEYFSGCIIGDYINFYNSHWDHRKIGVLNFSSINIDDEEVEE